MRETGSPSGEIPQMETQSTPMSERCQRQPQACARCQDVLPVIDEPAVDPRLVAQARDHVAICFPCQQVLLDYARIDVLLRRIFAVVSVTE